MPKLKSILRSIKGSALVVTLAFAIVMAIAGSGMMLLSGNSVRHEANAFENDRAFLSAESGLLIGKRWLADTVNWKLYNKTGKSVVYTGVISGIPDTVRLTMDSTGELELVSEATGPNLGYKKRLSWGIRRNDVPNPGVFINDLGPEQKGVGQGGLDNIWFDGPFHSNTPIYLSAVSNSGAKGASVYFKNGRVTVHNKTEKVHFNAGHWGEYGTGPSGNNYDFGVLMKDGQSQGTYQGDKLDSHFQGEFVHSMDSLYMPRLLGQDVLLPVNNQGCGRALLHYDTSAGAGEATYYYYNGSCTRLDTTFSVGNRVIRARNPLGVLGIVKGQTTLVSDSGNTIYPVGDIMYADFTPDADANYDKYDDVNNYGAGFDQSANADAFAIVSGGDIHFEDGYKQLFDKATETLYDAPNGAMMYLTGSLIAIEPGRGLMWDTKNMTGDAVDLLQNNFNYRLRAIGTRTLDWFFNFTLAGGTVANNQFRFFMDQRMLDSLKAPGVPGYKSTSSTGEKLFILKTDWRERNIPIAN